MTFLKFSIFFQAINISKFVYFLKKTNVHIIAIILILISIVHTLLKKQVNLNVFIFFIKVTG